jgi:4-alpha-glucanotransferase
LPRFRDFEDDTEEHRVHNQRQGEQLFQILLEEIGSHRLIAEDLGEVAPYVRPTLEALEIPGFKIPQWERRGDRLTSGSDYQRLSLATYATHDHPPLHTLWDDLFQKSQSDDQSTRDAAIHSSWELMDFCGCPDHQLPQPFTPEIHEILLRGLFASNSWLAIPMITDIFGTTERFNVPGSEAGKNWTQRVEQPVALWENAWVDRLTVMRRLLPESGRGRK